MSDAVQRAAHDDPTVPVSSSPTVPAAFEDWYTHLDTVIAEAELTDPKVARKVKEPFTIGGKLVDTACEDKNANCSWWAEIGECQSNPGYAHSHPPPPRSQCFCGQRACVHSYLPRYPVTR